MEDKIVETEQWVKNQMLHERTGHDWYHVARVTRLAEAIAMEESANVFIVKMAALLHDVADDKLVDDEEAALASILEWMESLSIPKEQMDHIMEIIQTISFKGGAGEKVKTLEAEIVQDADRIDALGAIGIARTFQYSGAKGQAMYDPHIKVRESMTFDQYRNEESTAINHFHEKLLKLKDRMNTRAGKRIAHERHLYMEQFLHQFMHEWEE